MCSDSSRESQWSDASCLLHSLLLFRNMFSFTHVYTSPTGVFVYVIKIIFVAMSFNKASNYYFVH